jgi:predicted O-methyltransferase YrrM
VAERPNSFVPGPDDIRRAFASSSPADLVFFLRQCLERGGFDHALALSAALGERARSEPAVLLSISVARFVAGERREALDELERMARSRPEDLNVLSVLAEMRARSGDREGAFRALMELVGRYPDYPGGQALLASLSMPGPPYRDVLRAVHRALSPRTYLEIGVETGGTLALATTARRAVGVDPADFPLEQALPPAASIFRETSDAFFAGRTRESVFGSDTVDLAFIDGMHLFEYALRDFANVERWCSPTSTVILHDCVPLAPVAAERERRTRFWVGDTYKLVWALARHRPDLKVRTVLTPPSGLVVIRRLDPTSDELSRGLAAIEQEFASFRYPYEPGRFPPELHVVTNDATGVGEALA